MNDEIRKLTLAIFLISTVTLFSTGHWIGGLVLGFFLGTILERW